MDDESADQTDPLTQQIEFIKEVDRLKQVQRKSFVSGARRLETSAEHSWHVTLMALVLGKTAAPPGVDLERVQRMLLVHDLAEIDAGDVLLYAGAEAHAAHKVAERKAAERLFGLLPAEQGAELRALWDEFEARASPEAKFAAALDRLAPLLLNYMAEGAAWRRYGVTAAEVYEKNRHMAEGSEALWKFAEKLIDECVQRGYLKHEI
jgi:putative hydrolase of HD superfamily